jgi:hypothetical protein
MTTKHLFAIVRPGWWVAIDCRSWSWHSRQLDWFGSRPASMWWLWVGPIAIGVGIRKEAQL